MPDYFERKEMKYLLNVRQKEQLMKAISDWIVQDPYSPYTVSSAYLDFPSDLLMKRNMEKPAYRRKVRIRCYGEFERNSTCYLETKNKYKGITVKKRILMDSSQIEEFLKNRKFPAGLSSDAISLFNAQAGYQIRYGLKYERQAYYWKDDPSLRITFDDQICVRKPENPFCLQSLIGQKAAAILPDGFTLMEIKTANALPLRLARILGALQILPASFSKAGSAYRLLNYANEPGKPNTQNEKGNRL